MLHQLNAIKTNTRSDLRGLSYTETAVALHASGVPSRLLRSATPAQLTEWAARGVELAGLGQVQSTARRTLALNIAATRKTGSTPAEDTEYSEMWSTQTAAQRCHNAAHRLL